MPQHQENATKKLSQFPLPLLCGLLAFVLTVGMARATQGAASSLELRVAYTVWGIISYTKWPEAKGALRVCLPGGDNLYAGFIRRSADKVALGRKIVVRTTPTDPAGTCDVVYFPAMSLGDAGRALRPLGGSPILTIGEGETFCSAGGMFCLMPGDEAETETIGAGRFAANLDATSRSPLRVNPQVLRLSKRNTGGKK